MNSRKTEVDVMALNKNVPLSSRGKRIAGDIAGGVVGILTPYAMYQAAAHDAVSPDIAMAIFERIGNGTINTIEDAMVVLGTIWENFPALKSQLAFEILGSIEEPTFENPWLERFGGQPEPSYDDLRVATDIAREASGAIERDGGQAWDNMLNSTQDTLGAMGGVWASSWIGRKIIGTMTLGDNPTLGQRLRFRFFNMFRSKNSSRSLNIPRHGGNTFTRK